MATTIQVQYATTCDTIPNKKKIIDWAKHALTEDNNSKELTIKIVDEEEIKELNRKWRGINKSTNVLSFPAGENPVAPDLLGDIAICAPVITKEAKNQHKTNEAHWAHMIVHGVLHLLGYDHINDKDANSMESHEIELLKKLNFPNPYE